MANPRRLSIIRRPREALIDATKPGFARRGRSLLPGQRSELVTIGADGNDRRVVFVAEEIIEAPNWTTDGTLIFNAGGELWRIPADGSAPPRRIDTGDLHDLNNDHCLAPDGRSIYVSSDDGHLYVLPISGSEPKRISNPQPGRFKYYLHGVSPDGATLVYVGVQSEGGRDANIYTIPATGGADRQLTHTKEQCDGPEYSPDGAWIWFNGEINTPGHAQIYRMRADGTELTQVTYDERVNWFPHLSPDGQWVAYLSYPPGTAAHPADRDVIIRIMRPDGTGMRDLDRFNGGQGTINVNSWSPDGTRLAYVVYPTDT